MKINKLLETSLSAALLLSSVLSISAQSSVPVPEDAVNASLHNYINIGRWTQPVTSYLFDNGNGLTRLQYTKGKIVLEQYSKDFALLSSSELPMELDLWGGFYHMENGNYLIFGQNNPDCQDETEVLRVVKYGQDWNRIGQTSVSGSNTLGPFEAGTVRCAHDGSMLYIHTAHRMYSGHQSNWTLALDTDPMEFTFNRFDVSNLSTGYISHSFNQFILNDGENIVTLDHGDAYPRAITLVNYQGKAGEKELMDQSSYFSSDRPQSRSVITLPGEIGNNDTNTALGGFAKCGDGYKFVFTYNGSNPAHPAMDGQSGNNVYSAQVDQSGNLQSVTKLNADLPGTNPILVSTGDHAGYILWNDTDPANPALYYVSYEDDTYSQPKKEAATISDCQPVIYEGK